MRRKILSITTLLWFGTTGCGRSAPEPNSPQQGVREAPEASVGGPAAGILGDWELRGDPPQRPPGLSLSLTVDSATDARYFGRLTHFFAGDVGRDPREFAAFAAPVRPDGVVRFAIPTVDPEMLGIVLEGAVLADTLWLSLFVLGPDTLSDGVRRWALVRGR